MIARVARLTAAEALKLRAQPLFWIALALIGLITVGTEIGYAVFVKKESLWRGWHALHLFAIGYQIGLKVATYVLVVFAAMLIAGEFDRGTVKNLLTRPVTRTDVFVSKCVIVALLGILLFGFVLYTALAAAFALGDLGPVWDESQYLILRSADDVLWYTRQAVGMTLLPLLAAGFLGLWISTWTESSGYAVAIAVVLFLAGDIVSGWMRESAQQKVFFYYPAYATAKLLALLQGEGWKREALTELPYLRVPAAYMAAFIPPAYVLFRFKNIHS